ncbi:MAG: aminotransferase class V-fold PLP-dependent enzyme [Planctomycetes bacterium]|nr:aminotransferase class V-fold PLP-dependent enzyme [Planctomycetota bacterium]
MKPLRTDEVRGLFVGLDHEVPLLDGRKRPYVNLDNAATTPPLRAVLDHIVACAEWYSSVHRGTGFKSQISTEAFRQAHEEVLRFVGADPAYHTAVFCANATDGINRLSHRFPQREGEVILLSVMEHHSNMLPWRFRGAVDHVRCEPGMGTLDLQDLEDKLCRHSGRVPLVAVTGASNVTGRAPPLGRVARMAHEHGALLLVDASQLIAHRPIVMGGGSDPERIDFLAFSGHKVYAPFGSGALIGPRAFFAQGRPGLLGGGAVKLVTLDDVEWAEVPEKEEAGTPNLLGICALVASLRTLSALRMERIAARERELTNLALERFAGVGGLHVYGGNGNGEYGDRVGIIPFQLEGFRHAHLAAVLAYEWGIGVRNGCFCAQPYVADLLGVAPEESRAYIAAARGGHLHEHPGFVRASLALYNAEQEIEYLAEALASIGRDGCRGEYVLDEHTGEYRPRGMHPPSCFDLPEPVLNLPG